MERVLRSFQIVGQSYRVLMQDPELMLLPVLSGAAMMVVIASFAVGFGFTNVSGPAVDMGRPELYVPIFLGYVALNTVALFFQCAVVAGATERMRGGDPTVGSALAAAGRRIVSIVIWAIFASTIGMLLRAIQERVGIVGKLVVGLVGAAWSVATFFVVPVLVLEDDVPLGEVLGRSVDVFRNAWGETIAGGATIGVASFIVFLILGVIATVTVGAFGSAALIACGLVAVLLMVFFSALNGVYVASLYRYATQGIVPSGFDRATFDDAFRARR